MAKHFESPRSILITGASSGIGEALARAYAAPGVALALT
ncbi:MAG: short-chain dehydrogenase, partial [Proteobacteria bacterium]|nr:short-chain dehydrogenase [Pseudomonadota bacterium]